MLLHIWATLVKYEKKLLICLLQRSAKFDIHVACENGSGEKCHPEHPIEEIKSDNNSTLLWPENFILIRWIVQKGEAKKYAKDYPLSRKSDQVDIEQSMISLKRTLVQLFALQEPSDTV